MTELMLAKSKAGHDKNHIYVVQKQEGNMVYLVNGVTKPLAHPKKKKTMHIQPIRRLPEEVTALVKGQIALDDALVIEILKRYNRRKDNVKGRCD